MLALSYCNMHETPEQWKGGHRRWPLPAIDYRHAIALTDSAVQSCLAEIARTVQLSQSRSALRISQADSGEL
jgi:hypothetical protein